ncbi:MAG: 3-oxoacyl-ACP synthase [Bacteroidales bacterium]|nr:3-oxoacyl-ACP synthase [Bacteroidales bacterium]
MIVRLSDNIVSPLGFTTEENYSAVERGERGGKYYEGLFGIPEPCYVSLLDNGEVDSRFSTVCHSAHERYTKLEKICIISAADAITKAGVDASDKRVIFILSTTKGNIDLLDNRNDFENGRENLWVSAQLVSRYFGNPNEPVVVSNACISGCAAQVAAMRCLQCDGYKYAVVVGADVLSKFVISGFQSFKALSQQLCKPFDKDRNGLNLGEAAATIVYAHPDVARISQDCIVMRSGSLSNDANHISGPSRTGEGLYRSICRTLDGYDVSNLAFVSAHGTSTPYNDDMESMALMRAGLSEIPVFSLKGHFGHTLGASGVLETVMSMHALMNGCILKSEGTENPGTVQHVNVNMQMRKTDGRAFLKLMSGFGGSNASILIEHKQSTDFDVDNRLNDNKARLTIHSYCRITDNMVIVGGQNIVTRAPSSDVTWLSQIYKSIGLHYPKFYKMDNLSKAGLLAAEMLIPESQDIPKDDWSVVVLNRSSSLDDDKAYQETISAENYYPAPSIFVYTLANIVTGEISIRHKIFGESACYIFEHFDETKLEQIIRDTFSDSQVRVIIGGWVEYYDDHCDVLLLRVHRDDVGIELTKDNIKKIY